MIQSVSMLSITDSCFIEIDLSSKEAISKYQEQTSIDIEASPSASIWKAAETGDIEALEYFLQHNTELLNMRDPNTECTLLHLLVSNVQDPIRPLELLLKHGVDVTAQNIYNVQAIHAVFLNCPYPLEAVRLLLSYDANPNARDGDGWTPLHYAARFCQSPGPVLKLLIDAGADVNAVDVNQKSALFSLLANGDHSQTLDWLIHTAKANLKIKGDFVDSLTRRTRQGTLILQAAKYGRFSCLQLLVNSETAMQSLQSVLTREELDDAIDIIRMQLLKLSTREQIEKLGSMIILLEELTQKLSKKKNKSKHHSVIKRRPNLLRRIVAAAIYILNLFMAPDMKRYLIETPLSDDIYQLPVHLQRLVLEARMELKMVKENGAYQRLERVRDFVRSVAGPEDTAAMIQVVNHLVYDDDELSTILGQ
ncbi:ankyrin repeat-containing domain protein [Rhizopus microsporus]